jgi:hypothetical protein
MRVRQKKAKIGSQSSIISAASPKIDVLVVLKASQSSDCESFESLPRRPVLQSPLFYQISMPYVFGF